MKRVLVVDDRSDNRDLLCTLLQGHGFAVEQARHGAEALARARQSPPDVVVSDLLMPVMDGYALLRHWKADPQLAGVPFVVYTATYTDARDERLALDLGADAFIVKPAEPEVFMAQLQRVLACVAAAPATQAVADDAAGLEAYNAALVRKLEAKAEELERRVAGHESTLRSLAASEARYRALFQNSMDMILLTRPDGSVLAANPAACRGFGLSEAELCARGRAGLVDPGDPRLPILLAERARRGEVRGELTVRRGDGSPMPVELTTNIFDDGQGGQATSMILRDISERKRAEAAHAELEAQLRQAQKLEAVGTLAGGIAHDFNNVLGAMLGYVVMAEEDVRRGQPVAEHLAQIRTAGQRARALVQRILAFSRHQPTTLKAQPLQPLLQETQALLRGTLPAGVALQLRMAAEARPVRADSTQVQQVLLNLVTNAWHALPQGYGRVEIGLDFMALPQDGPMPAGLPPGRYAHLWVADNGNGMDEATRERAFEPFFTTKPVGQGTGLGLAAVHGIVRHHGGAVTLDSAPGQGTTVHVWLPLADAEAAPEGDIPAPPAAQALPCGGLRVLYVDDDETIGMLAGQLLQRAGCRPTVFTDAALALDALRADPGAFDIVVTDHHMPRLSGLDLAAAIRQLAPSLPVILGSGYVDAALQAACEKAGVSELLRKELLSEQLVPALQRAAAKG